MHTQCVTHTHTFIENIYLYLYKIFEWTHSSWMELISLKLYSTHTHRQRYRDTRALFSHWWCLFGQIVSAAHISPAKMFACIRLKSESVDGSRVCIRAVFISHFYTTDTDRKRPQQWFSPIHLLSMESKTLLSCKKIEMNSKGDLWTLLLLWKYSKTQLTDKIVWIKYIRKIQTYFISTQQPQK